MAAPSFSRPVPPFLATTFFLWVLLLFSWVLLLVADFFVEGLTYQHLDWT